MPEGPEMYRIARKVSDTLGRDALTEIWFAFERLQVWSERLVGQPLANIETLGKALLLRFADDTVIYTHNQLYGRWMFADAGRRPDTNRQLRLALSSKTRSALLYSASDIEVIPAGQLNEHPFVARAGLDILSSGACVEQTAAWMGKKRFARRQLGHLLLDQAFLAGVGNYLRSEILFRAGLHWTRRPADLGPQALDRLAHSAHVLMWRSVETGGMTNDPDVAKRLKQAGWAWRDYRHYVFGRDGQVCLRCDRPIERAAVSGRRLYWCPRCQRDPR